MGIQSGWYQALVFLDIIILAHCADYRPQKNPPQPPPPPPPVYQSYVSQPEPAPEQQYIVTLDTINPLCIPQTNTTHLDAILSQIQDDLANKVPRNFDRILDMGSSNPQAMGQKWMTAVRQLISAVSYPDNAGPLPADIQDRARVLLQNFPGGSIGSYTDAQGVELIRTHVADFLWRRDYIQANVSTIFLTNGRVDALRDIVDLFSQYRPSGMTGVLVPNPTWPSLLDIIVCSEQCQTGYLLEEDSGWAITLPALQAALDEQALYCNPVALVIENPSNPTGHIHSRDELEIAIRFARANNLVIIADEGLQENIIETSPGFISVRKVAAEIGVVIEIASIVAATTGYVAEAGLRGAVYELLNYQPEVVELNNAAQSSRKSCPNAVGQITVELLVNPPKKGEPSFAKWDKEKAAFLVHLRKNAELVSDRLNAIPGISASRIQGANHVFAKLDLPDRYIERALSAGVSPDILYAQELLQEKGVILFPGTWYHEQLGTNHIRINLLPNIRDLKLALIKLDEWQRYVLDTYSSDIIVEPAPYETTTPGYY